MKRGEEMSVYAKRETVKGLVAFSVRITPELKKRLEDRAYDERKSQGLVIEEILEKELLTKS